MAVDETSESETRETAHAPPRRTGRPPIPATASSYGALLRSVRASRGLTLARFASRLRISPAFLSRVERGQRLPSHRTPLRISRIVHLDSRAFGALALSTTPTPTP